MGAGMARTKVSEVVRDVYRVTIGRGLLSTNVYLIRSGSSWTLVDAGWFGSEQKIRAAAESVFGREARPESMVLTHLHPDHSGAIATLSESWGQSAYVQPDELPLAAGYQQAYAIPLDRWLMPVIRRLPKQTQVKIAAGSDLTAVVQAFDPEAGIPGLPDWESTHSHGHSPGHISLYRREDGVLITGDAVVTVDLNSLLGLLTGRQGVFGSPRYSTWDWPTAQRSIAALATSEPTVLATGHGRVRFDETARALQALAAGQDMPARWRQGLFTGVDYSARTRYRPPPVLYQQIQRRLSPFLIGLGFGPKQVIVLEVPGRRSGVIRRNSLVKTSHKGNDYLVALAGESEWVRNVRAANGQVVIGRRQRRAARLVELPPGERPPILRAYLLRWGRQPNSPAVQREAGLFFGVGGDPSVEELAAIAEFYPVFRISTAGPRSVRQQPDPTDSEPGQQGVPP
jgi:glyoxylase-like metal-dependent hydrolase (beta-lactamase superfamily II)